MENALSEMTMKTWKKNRIGKGCSLNEMNAEWWYSDEIPINIVKEVMPFIHFNMRSVISPKSHNWNRGLRCVK